MFDYVEKLDKAISLLDQEREAELAEVTGEINEKYSTKGREIVKKM